MKHIKRFFILKARSLVTGVDLGGGAKAKINHFHNVVAYQIKGN